LTLEAAIDIADMVKTIEFTNEELSLLQKFNCKVEKEIQFGTTSTMLVLNQKFYEFYKLTKENIACYLFCSKKDVGYTYKISLYSDDLFSNNEENKFIVNSKDELFTLLDSNLLKIKIDKLQKYSNDLLKEFYGS
jgi:hypothetical protein